MNDDLVISGLIVVAILVLIPLVMIGWLVIAIIAGYREHRRAEARKVTKIVPQLGEFSTTDNMLWFGEVRGLHVTLNSRGQPPTELQARHVLALMDDLPALLHEAGRYPVDHENVSSLEGGAPALEPYSVEMESATAFVLELTDPADPDGVYRVEFRDRLPVSSGRDD